MSVSLADIMKMCNGISRSTGNYKERVNVSQEVEQFHRLVIQDLSLKEKLKQSANQESFVKLAVQLGKENGYSFTPSEVESYINRNMLTLMRQFS